MVNIIEIRTREVTMANEQYESRAAYDYAQSKKFSVGALTHAAAIAFGVSFVAFTLGAALADDKNAPVAPAQCQSYSSYKAC